MASNHCQSANGGAAFLLRDDFEQAVDHCRNAVSYRLPLMALYASGLRRAELAHLKVTDLDTEQMVIHRPRPAEKTT